MNNSQHPTAFYVGNRARFATATGVKLVGDDRLVCTTLLGQRLFLVRFDMRARSYTIDACIPTRDGSTDVSTDLLDYDGKDRLLTSNCEHGSFSIYRLAADAIEFVGAVSMKLAGIGYCHGAKFVPGRDDLVCMTSLTRDRCVAVVSLETGGVVGRFSDDAWLPKDVAFVTPRLLAVSSTRAHVGMSPGEMGPSKVSLLAFDESYRSHQIRHEIVCDDAQFDGCHVRRDLLYVTDQMEDVIRRFRIRGDRLERLDAIAGFSFPHAVDVSADGRLLAVANYGLNAVTLRRLR